MTSYTIKLQLPDGEVVTTEVKAEGLAFFVGLTSLALEEVSASLGANIAVVNLPPNAVFKVEAAPSAAYGGYVSDEELEQLKQLKDNPGVGADAALGGRPGRRTIFAHLTRKGLVDRGSSSGGGYYFITQKALELMARRSKG